MEIAKLFQYCTDLNNALVDECSQFPTATLQNLRRIISGEINFPYNPDCTLDIELSNRA